MRWGHRGRQQGALLAAGALGAMAAVVPPTPTPTARAGTPWDACPEAAVQQRDAVLVRGPRYTLGPLLSTSLVADAADPLRLTASNGTEVHVTDDAGCTWSPVFTTSRPGQSGTTTAVAREGDGVRVLVPVRVATAPNLGGLHLFRVYARDAGVEAARDLPPEMPARECSETYRCLARFAPGRDLAVAYVASPGLGTGTLPKLASTTDSGRTWTTEEVPAALGDLAVDPDDDARLLAVANGTLHRSTDRGATWALSVVPAPLSPEGRVVFTPGGPGDAVVVDRGPGGSTVLESHDGGATFMGTGTVIPAAPVRDVAVGPAPDGEPALYVAAGGRLFRSDGEGGFETVLRQGAAIDQVAPTTTGVWARRAGALLFVPSDETPDEAWTPTPPPGIATPAGDLTARATGGRLHPVEPVVVPPHGTGVAVVTADVGRQPRGIDVFFLMDTSGSMTAKIAPMARALGRVVDALNREGVSARFGLAEYGDSSYRYRRLADLGTPPEEVQRQFATLRGFGCCEYQYQAFYQLATGAGLRARSGGSIAPGQHASFDPGALHVVVHATDDDDAMDPEAPDEATAMAALNAVAARHVGIYPYNGGKRNATNEYQTVTLRRYAAATGTFAPSGGLDCDGDGAVDVREGEPIACAIEGSTSADAPIATLIERVLLSLATYEDVAVAAGATPLGVAVFPLGDYRQLDMHQANTGLRFQVDVTCPPEQYGTEHAVPLAVLVGSVAVARGFLPVTCTAPVVAAPEAPPEDHTPPRRPPPRALPAVPPAATSPPALAQSVASAQATSSASSSAQATQAGFAFAPDDAAELARAYEDDTRFVAHRRPAPSPAPLAAALAVGIALLSVARVRVAAVLAHDRRIRRW